MKIIELNEFELSNINGGGPLWDEFHKNLEDAGQYVVGFLDGLFTGDCPESC